MSETPRRPRRWPYFLAGLLMPGLGHAFLGRFREAALLYSLALVFVVVLSYVAAWSPLVMGFAAFFVPLWLLTSGALAFRRAGRVPPEERRFSKSRLALFLFLAAVGYAAISPLRRVTTYYAPAVTMEPKLLRGDSFALDHHPSAYHVGDLVAIEQGMPKSLFIRRLKALSGATATVGLDRDAKDDISIPSERLRGRALYVVYSVDPETHRWRTDRFLRVL